MNWSINRIIFCALLGQEPVEFIFWQKLEIKHSMNCELIFLMVRRFANCDRYTVNTLQMPCWSPALVYAVCSSSRYGQGMCPKWLRDAPEREWDWILVIQPASLLFLEDLTAWTWIHMHKAYSIGILIVKNIKIHPNFLSFTNQSLFYVCFATSKE